MSKSSTRATIDANIKQNGQQQITGQILNSVLNTMVTDYAEQEDTSAKLGALSDKADELEGSVFNSDTQKWDYKKNIPFAPDDVNEIISYLGLTNCKIKIDGINQQAFQIIATNKDTGNIITLYRSTTPVSLPIEFDNPRPDLELIDMKIVAYSSTISIPETLKITITKESPFPKFEEEVSLLKSIADGYGKVVSISNMTPVFSMVGLIIRPDGSSQESSTFFSSTPIKIGRGQSISFNVSVSANASMLSECLYDGTFVSSIMVGENIIKERTYIALKDMYVRICCVQQNPTITINSISAFRDSEIKVSNVFEHYQASSGQMVRPYKIQKGHTYRFVNTSKEGVAMNVRTRATKEGTNIDEVVSNFDSWEKNHTAYFTASADADFIWSFINNEGGYKIEDVASIEYRLKELEGRQIAKKQQVRFDLEKQMKDMSSILSEFDFTDKMYQANIVAQIDSKFLDLYYTYPNIVSRNDAVNFANGAGAELSYPIYANGVTTEGTYKVTPLYRTYLWKISSEDATLTGNGARPKKKVFLIGGTHGNEKFAMYNLYAFAKLLASCADSNYYKLLASCDFYILPCLNGYGAYHTMRGNANHVNINRNYPVWGWTRNDPDAPSRYEDLACDYTGDSAGSEFETQLIIGCAKRINPDLIIDHHNYGEESSVQFYTEYGEKDNQNLINQSAIDVWQKLVENMPTFFGRGYGANLLSDIEQTLSFTTTKWATEFGCDSYTIEVGHSINYSNGSPITSGTKASFNADVAKIAEYTLRQQLLIYIDAIMKK